MKDEKQKKPPANGEGFIQLNSINQTQKP